AAVNGPFATYNYTYNIGNKIREDILYLLQDNLAKIGIKVIDAGVTWSEFIYKLFDIPPYNRNMVQLFYIGWAPDFNDPSAILNTLFTNRSVAYNSAQVNDEIVQQWMEEALDEVDQVKREVLYDKIQKRLVEEVYPLVWGTVEKLYFAHHVNLTGFQPNTLEMNYFYPCQWDPWYVSPRNDAWFKVGVSQGPYDLDPQNAWDQWSYQTIEQVCEGLYGYNYSDPEMEIIPYLATADGSWSPDGLNYTVPLRSGVTFHDGTLFNASAVKFTFDRLSYLINATGTNPGLIGLSILSQLYEFRDGTPIIDRMEVIDTYTIRFILNAPYAPLQALLCFSGSYILSPTSTPSMDYIDTNTGDLVGTGPFVYDGYIPNVEINFHAYINYWRGKAEIDLMNFKIYNNNGERLAALLTRDVDFIDDILPEWVDIYKGFSNITVLDEGKTNSYFSYLGMNNKQINVRFREAISYAMDYDYIINEVYEGSASRMKSPVPDGLRYANSTFDYPILNLTRARLAMQSIGYGLGYDLYDDTDWEFAAVNGPFATYNYTYNIGNKIREDILYLLQDNLAKIGIKVIDAGVTWSEFIYKLYDIGGYHRNMLQLYWLGWVPDFNDPSNFLDLMFSNISYSNFAQINDWQVSKWLQDALIETNPIQREMIYDKIQKRLVEEVYPWAWGVVGKLYTAYHEDLSGFQQNALERLYFYPCKWNKKVPDQFVLNSDAGTPDTDGNFNLTWSVSDGAINYTVYQYSSYITSINGSLTPLVVGTTGITLSLNAYTNGIYYFIIVAHNEYGETLSNCISVLVSLPGPDDFILLTSAGTPDIDGIFDLVWQSSSNADNYSVYQYDKYITVINGSLTLLAEEITDLTIPLSGYTTGAYYFIVVAYNEYGETLSNCVIVNVQIPIADSLIVIIPDSTTSWVKGSNHYIYWTSTGDISDVKIDLYRNDVLVMEIVPSTLNNGVYYWTLPSTLADSTQYQIRIIDISNPSTYNFSDYFTIKSPASTTPEIPGYNFFLIIGITCIISVILLKNRRKNYTNS
ncbi:MAG: ABC transporter substrate-binding protein, partial [Promethearchaeota archaeon]